MYMYMYVLCSKRVANIVCPLRGWSAATGVRLLPSKAGTNDKRRLPLGGPAFQTITLAMIRWLLGQKSRGAAQVIL